MAQVLEPLPSMWEAHVEFQASSWLWCGPALADARHLGREPADRRSVFFFLVFLPFKEI